MIKYQLLTISIIVPIRRFISDARFFIRLLLFNHFTNEIFQFFECEKNVFLIKIKSTKQILILHRGIANWLELHEF